MSRIKFIIISFALTSSVITAIATTPKWDCSQVPNFFWNGVGYSPAGVFGSDYYCANGTDHCTYYLNNNIYTPCKMGTYTPLHANKK